MAASLWRRLAKPLALHATGEPIGPKLEADWSAISPAGLGMVFKELLAHLLGAPPPKDLHKDFYALGGHHGTWSKNLNLEDIYFHRHFVEGVESGFLVRGVIFDMPALIQTSKNVTTVPKKWEDWTTMLDFTASDNLKLDDSAESVSASEVAEKLGLKGLPSLKDKLPGVNKVEAQPRKSKLQEKQELEDVIGTGDSIRAKYLLKIQAKKIEADARREQGNLEIASPSGSRLAAGDRGWQAMAGSSGVVRYLEERGISQALLARGDKGDVTYLLDQLGNFKFQHIADVRIDEQDTGTGELISNDTLKSICSKWGLPAKQVMVVLGDGPQSDAVLRVVADSGFFVCRMGGGSVNSDLSASSSGTTKNHFHEYLNRNMRVFYVAKQGVNEKGKTQGLVSWFHKLSEGTLHKDDYVESTSEGSNIHFTVADMTELKWVIEDLNGTSYRRNTFVLGSEPLLSKAV